MKQVFRDSLNLDELVEEGWDEYGEGKWEAHDPKHLSNIVKGIITALSFMDLGHWYLLMIWIFVMFIKPSCGLLCEMKHVHVGSYLEKVQNCGHKGPQSIQTVIDWCRQHNTPHWYWAWTVDVLQVWSVRSCCCEPTRERTMCSLSRMHSEKLVISAQFERGVILVTVVSAPSILAVLLRVKWLVKSLKCVDMTWKMSWKVLVNNTETIAGY